MWKLARPCDIERISVAYPNISDSGTIALTTCVLPTGFIDSIRPRRELRLPITSPRYSSGVVTSTPITGSSRTGFARFIASLNAIEPAILNARSLEAVDDDLEVELAHAGDQRLAGLLVGGHAEGRVLLGQASEA